MISTKNLWKFATSKYRVVMLRHGESAWNKENRFTGWTDVRLSETGVKEAKDAGKVLKEKGYTFDLAYTSVLSRAIQTFNYAAEELDLLWIPLIKDWRLNERHYGGLQGLNKSETAKLHGEDKVKVWRRSYDIPPPVLDINDKRHPIHDKRYANVPKNLLPATESLKLTIDRVMPLWNGEITNIIKSGKQLLIVAHGNSIRSIVKFLDNISEKEITDVDIPTGIPLVYEFDESLKPIKHFYLADPAELEKKVQAVKSQGKAKK